MIERHGQPWAPDEEAALLRGFRSGDTLAELSGAHGRTPGAVVNRLVLLGALTLVGKAYHAVAPEPWTTFKHIKALKGELK